SGALALSGDGTKLVVGPSENVASIVVMSLVNATYGTVVSKIDTNGSAKIFDVRLDPFDPNGNGFYATDQTKSRLLVIDANAGSITRTIALDKNPAQMAFLDATYMVVAEADHDALAVVDRVAGTVEARVPVFDPKAPHGFSPTALAYDAAAKRLYAVLASVNAIEAYDVSP